MKTTDSILGTNLIALGVYLLDQKEKTELEQVLAKSSLDQNVYQIAKDKDFEKIIENAFNTNLVASAAGSAGAKIETLKEDVKAPEPEPEPVVSFASFF